MDCPNFRNFTPDYRCTLALMMSKPPPPPGHPLIHHFRHARLCRAQMEGVDQISDAILPFREFWALQSPGSLGMPIDCMYRDAGLVEAFLTLDLLTTAAWPIDVPQPPPPPPGHPLNCQCSHAGLCRAQMNHSDQFQPSCYQFDSTGLCRAQDPTKCKFTLCWIAVTWWIAALLPFSMALVHTGTKTEVARISKKFSHRLANFGAWQGGWEHSESTPWPPLQALLKAGLWVSD